MKASIVIPNLNGAGWLRDSIESIWAQTEQDFELIVVDNGSTDESLAIAKSYEGRARYTLICNARNTGFSHAVNEAAEADEKIFAVQSLMIRHFERELADDAGDYVTLFGWACKRGDGFPWRRYQKPGRIFSACGGASLYRRRILDEIGLFDELFFAYFEDVDISWRANSLGYKAMYCPAAKCYHICGATTGAVRYNEFKSVQSGRNSILLPYKNMPILMFLLNFLFLLAGYLLKVLVFGLRGFWTPYLKGAREAFAAIPKLNKPKFRLKNLPHYALIEVWLFWNCFAYASYRIRRFFAARRKKAAP